MPSRPSLQAWAKTVGPSPSMCSLNRMPGLALATIDASVALRTSKRITPQVVAVQLDEIEGVEEYALVSAVVPDEVERSNAVVIAGDSPPSIMQERERRRANVSTISRKRWVRSLPGRL